ncbi:uncharacterized protein LOC132551305 [Ylistrum balloti]|uniref:uncharacterized protein LOC132551305 n=1 Tax=Ylistrum balloti TaxID=509963 RepID=UPI0029058A91|nr:uncharacterized protein LOC132551305 [Ylistrum balloti]
MATHFACQPTEPLAHKYPLVQKVEKSHGAVSSYEVLNLGDKAHTRFPPPGWDTSQSSEESIPLCQAPAPWKGKKKLIGPDPSLCISPDKGSTYQKQSHKPMYPIPKQHEQEHLIGPDPDLCITPEKQLGGAQKSNLKHDNEDLLKAKNQHRVRFELENSLSDSDKENLNDSLGKTSGPGKTYRPSAYSESGNIDGGISESSSKPKQYTIRQDDLQTVYVPLGTNTDKVPPTNKSAETKYSVLPTVLPKEDNSSGKDIVIKTKKSGKKSSKKVLSENSKQTAPSSGKNFKQTVKPEVEYSTAVPKRKVRVTRESKDDLLSNDYKFPFSEEGETALEYEHVFTRPEYNSTLRMRTELEHIKGSEVDVQKALERKLQTSNKKQTEIREKAASRVNQVDEEFGGLVSLHIPVDNLCSQIEKEKTERVKPSQVYKPQVFKDRKEPDLMELFTPDLQKQYPELSVPGLAVPTESLSTASQHSAFDLYRHNRVWEGTSNFRGGNK